MVSKRIGEVPRPVVREPDIQRALGPLVTVLDAIARFLGPFSRPEGWRKPELVGEWQNYTGTLNLYQLAGYKKGPMGRVYLRGYVERASGLEDVIFQLPQGYRPSRRVICTTTGSSGVGRVDVLEDGRVLYMSGGVAGLVLDGLAFDTV